MLLIVNHDIFNYSTLDSQPFPCSMPGRGREQAGSAATFHPWQHARVAFAVNQPTELDFPFLMFHSASNEQESIHANKVVLSYLGNVRRLSRLQVKRPRERGIAILGRSTRALRFSTCRKVIVFLAVILFAHISRSSHPIIGGRP